MKINEEQMCCYHCGYIAPLNEPYDEEPSDDDESFPVCPKCGEFNCGGYSSFAPVYCWSADTLDDIISRAAYRDDKSYEGLQ